MLDALVNRPNTILEQQKRFQVNLPFLLLTPSHQSTTQTDNDSFVRLGGSASCVPEDAQIAPLHGCVPLSLRILISCRFLIPERSEITGAFLTVFGVGVLGITQGVYKMALVSFSLPLSSNRF